MGDKKKFNEAFEKPPRWRQIKEQLQMTSEHMKELAGRFTEDGREHLTESDKNLVSSAYSPHIAEVTNSLRINMISRERSRSVDDIEEIHKILEILDCL